MCLLLVAKKATLQYLTFRENQRFLATVNNTEIVMLPPLVQVRLLM